MGKKKIAAQTTEEALKEKAEVDQAVEKTVAKTSAKKFERGRVYINTSYNNTMISVTDEKGNMVAWSSAGALGFSGPKKATPFAASKGFNILSIHDVTPIPHNGPRPRKVRRV